MKIVDAYIASVKPAEKALFKEMSRVLKDILPDVEQGLSYGMPSYLYKGKGVLSFVVAKKFLSMYPFSGKVLAKVETQLKGFETTTGSVHFSVEHPIPESLLREIITLRIQEINDKLAK